MKKVVLTGCLLAAISASSSWAAEIKISMAGHKFAPAAVNAKIGDALVLVNDDGVPHNVFSSTIGHSLDMGPQPAGQSRNFPLKKAGAFVLRCITHPEMAPITVTVVR